MVTSCLNQNKIQLQACLYHYKYFLVCYGYVLPFLGLRVHITTSAISFKKTDLNKNPSGFPFRNRLRAGSRFPTPPTCHLPPRVWEQTWRRLNLQSWRKVMSTGDWRPVGAPCVSDSPVAPGRNVYESMLSWLWQKMGLFIAAERCVTWGGQVHQEYLTTCSAITSPSVVSTSPWLQCTTASALDLQGSAGDNEDWQMQLWISQLFSYRFCVASTSIFGLLTPRKQIIRVFRFPFF